MKNSPSQVLTRLVRHIDLPPTGDGINDELDRHLGHLNMYNLINGRNLPKTINQKNIKYLYKAKKLSREQ